MSKRINILIQTTIPYAEDDWHVGRFSMLTDALRSQVDADGNAIYHITTRNREADANGIDPVLSELN